LERDAVLYVRKKGGGETGQTRKRSGRGRTIEKDEKVLISQHDTTDDFSSADGDYFPFQRVRGMKGREGKKGEDNPVKVDIDEKNKPRRESTG